MSGLTYGTPSDAEVLMMAMDARERATAKALPGTVVSYNAGAQTCTVRPGVHRLVPSMDDNNEDEVEELPAVQDVPVVWPAGRGFRLRGTLNPGDSVLLVAMDRDMDGWRRTGQPSEPDDSRMNSWGSCVAIPGLVPDSGSYGTPPTDAAALASKLDLFLRAVSGLADATNPATVIVAAQGILLAARAVVGGATGVPGTGTTASTVLTLSS